MINERRDILREIQDDYDKLVKKGEKFSLPTYPELYYQKFHYKIDSDFVIDPEEEKKHIINRKKIEEFETLDKEARFIVNNLESFSYLDWLRLGLFAQASFRKVANHMLGWEFKNVKPLNSLSQSLMQNKIDKFLNEPIDEENKE